MDVVELMKWNRTYRRFKSEPVPHEVIVRAIDSARTANSAANAQVLRYTAVESPDMVERFQPLVKWAASLPPELGTPKPSEQPRAFVVVSQVLRDGEPTPFADVDLGISAHALTMTAAAAGVGSCMMGAFSRASVERLVELPAGERARLVIALGYPDHASTIEDAPAGADLAYYLDDRHDYHVPKRSLGEVARFL